MMRPGMGKGPQDISRDLVDTTTVTARKDDDGKKYVNQYEIVKDLGKGSFGKVKLVKHTETGEVFAMKVFNKNVLRKKRMGTRNLLMDIEHEIKIMKKIDHPNCIKLYEVLDSTDYHKLYLRIEFATLGVSLSPEEDQKAEPLPEDKARKYFAGMLAGLEYLHTNNILHRDLKPENLLVCAGEVAKLGDFGSGQVLDDDNDMISKTAGTPAFTAPEACVEGEYSGKAADVWAAGVSLYYFVHGRVPFLSQNMVQIFEMIREQEIEYSPSLSPSLRDLLEKILEKDSSKRIALSEIKKHPWMNE
eukprot:CAMPEP_0184301016 /NCGR_PEP_ID=MMETSP1049-20130417/11304_1 /TAXON_ID=77928 /ORGANISM="Proteomonas sulcata, Strain CCMP704" /LENGTH=302 /DNA_ID=CAMNT_0026611881 /DNA_START=166 /DNA_END=1074 /DNA_ORIENTATION=+